MLVLTRKRSEEIQIGDDIRIKVIRTSPSTVKIGIEAPDHVRVLRAELCEAAMPVKSNPQQPLTCVKGAATVHAANSVSRPHCA